jgi:hypothetical protein
MRARQGRMKSKEVNDAVSSGRHVLLALLKLGRI